MMLSECWENWKMKNKLAIFDLDGTLFDTNEVNFQAYRSAMKELGYQMSYQYYMEHGNGRHYSEFLPALVQNRGDIERIHNLKKNNYKEYLNYARENKHLFSMIPLLQQDYHIAIVTTASRQNCDDILNYFEKKELFEYVVSQEDVENTKPDPEGILKAMRKFNMTSERTVIFEDSESGIKAGVKSGATVLKIENF